MSLRELSLFSGAGGGLLGTRLLGWTLSACVEFNPYCQRVLRARMADGVLEQAPIFSDVRDFNGSVWRGRIDVITAGFPCQPFSAAGRKRGADDPKNMWPATARIIREVQPQWVFLENVPRLLNAGRTSTGRSYFETVLSALAEAGFDAAWDCVSAAQIGAPHIRERLWVLAHNPSHTNSSKLREQPRRWPGEGWSSECLTGPNGKARDVANASGKRREERSPLTLSSAPQVARSGDLRQRGWWARDPSEGSHQPCVGRVAHGVANRSHRLAALGNGQVPAVVVAAFNHLHSILFA